MVVLLPGVVSIPDTTCLHYEIRAVYVMQRAPLLRDDSQIAEVLY